MTPPSNPSGTSFERAWIRVSNGVNKNVYKHNHACKEAKDNLFFEDNGRLSDSHDIWLTTTYPTSEQFILKV